MNHRLLKKLVLSALIVSLYSFTLVAQQVVYVKKSATGTNTGESWANAYTELQAALAAATSGTEIWVASGTYTPQPGAIAANVDRTLSFVLKNGVAIYGGFSGKEATRAERNWKLNAVYLSGDLLGDGSGSSTNADNAYTVVTASNTNSTAVIDGFYIVSGRADKATSSWSSADRAGAGIYGSAAGATISNISVSGCYADYGGGIFLQYSPISLINITLDGNEGRIGGGAIYLQNSNVTLTGITVRGNRSSLGAGLSIAAGTVTISRADISSNQSSGSGGGIYNNGGKITVANTLVAKNKPEGYRGGTNTGTVELINVTIADNIATGIKCGADNMSIKNSIVWGESQTSTVAGTGTLIVVNSNVKGGVSGTGNIIENPDFVDPASGNYRIPGTSPAIDAGSNALLPSGVTVDLDENNRIFDGNNDGTATVDMGAYEWEGTVYPPSAPVLVAPSNNLQSVLLQPTLTWNAAARAQSYTLQLSTDMGFATTIIDMDGLTDVSLAIPNQLASNTSYYWRVKAVSAMGESTWSQVWKFTTVANLPEKVTLHTPANGAQNIALSATLKWRSAVNAQTYKIQIASDANFTSIITETTDLTDTTFAQPFSLNTTYYWRVAGVSNGNAGPWSDGWWFKTIENVATYSVTFNVANADDEPITDATITLNGSTNDVGNYLFMGMEAGVYSYSVTKDGYLEATGEVTVTSSDVTHNVTLTLITYTVTFEVKSTVGSIVSNAVITLSAETNSAGSYVFANRTPATEVEYSVEAEGYFAKTGSMDIYKDTTVKVVLVPYFYTVVFNVVTPDNSAITNALVTFNAITEAEGNYTFSGLTIGSYGYTIAAADYQDVTGTVALNKDTTIKVIMLPTGTSTYDVTFSVVANGEALEGASVFIDGFGSQPTNASGNVVFSLPAGTYGYTASHGGHSTVNGEVTVTDDAVAVDVDLTVQGVGSNGTVVARAYPNPFTDMLRIDTQEPITLVELFSITGVKVAQVQGNGTSTVELPAHSIAAGIYLAKVRVGTAVRVIKVIKQ
ncbi:MAG: T9SS type A sorting domain-containing protein [Bacteroidales bacterium]|nr:T9SS type A sorting domain-containing protein [Bacteroidales bacterium]MBN2750861.1 T9SS type A sorting domain-containing protein [Bacteroidales bacterium]